jgi:hypothetical protein
MLRTLEQHRQPRPARVAYALVALWAAWTLSAVALGVNQIVFHGSGIGPGPSLGIISLIVQVALFVFVARGSIVARGLVVLLLAVAALPLQMIPHLLAERSIFSAGYTLLGFALKGVAAVLLFTGEANIWFAERSKGERN